MGQNFKEFHYIWQRTHIYAQQYVSSGVSQVIMYIYNLKSHELELGYGFFFIATSGELQSGCMLMNTRCDESLG